MYLYVFFFTLLIWLAALCTPNFFFPSPLMPEEQEKTKWQRLVDYVKPPPLPPVEHKSIKERLMFLTDPKFLKVLLLGQCK